MKVELCHPLENSFNSFLMGGGVGGVDEEVVNIDNEPSFGNHTCISEGIVHKLLKGGWGVHEAKEHYSWFKKPFVSDKSSFPLVAILNVNVVIAPS